MMRPPAPTTAAAPAGHGAPISPAASSNAAPPQLVPGAPSSYTPTAVATTNVLGLYLNLNLATNVFQQTPGEHTVPVNITLPLGAKLPVYVAANGAFAGYVVPKGASERDGAAATSHIPDSAESQLGVAIHSTSKGVEAVPVKDAARQDPGAASGASKDQFTDAPTENRAPFSITGCLRTSTQHPVDAQGLCRDALNEHWELAKRFAQSTMLPPPVSIKPQDEGKAAPAGVPPKKPEPQQEATGSAAALPTAASEAKRVLEFLRSLRITVGHATAGHFGNATTFVLTVTRGHPVDPRRAPVSYNFKVDLVQSRLRLTYVQKSDFQPIDHSMEFSFEEAYVTRQMASVVGEQLSGWVDELEAKVKADHEKERPAEKAKVEEKAANCAAAIPTTAFANHQNLSPLLGITPPLDYSGFFKCEPCATPGVVLVTNWTGAQVKTEDPNGWVLPFFSALMKWKARVSAAPASV